MEIIFFGMIRASKQLKLAILSGKYQLSLFDSLLSLKYLKMKDSLYISWNLLFWYKLASKQLKFDILSGKYLLSILDSLLSSKYLKIKDLLYISWN